MIQKRFISISIRRLTFSLLLLMAAVTASAQVKFFSFQKDSIPTFRGFAVSFDLVGAGLMQFSDNGQYEGALRVNLHDEWFPIVEAGLGRANHDDEVTIVVQINSKNRSVLKMPQPPVVAKKLIIVSLWAKSMATAFSRRVVRPRNMKAKPNTNSPKLRTLFLRTYERAIPKPKMGHTKLLMLNWKPNMDMIHAVAVVPILAPIITGIACLSVRRPAFTKLTVMTVVAVEDCTAAVTNVPVKRPPKRCLVMVPRTARRCPPVSFCKPSLIVFMPNMRSARQPIIFRIASIIL